MHCKGFVFYLHWKAEPFITFCIDVCPYKNHEKVNISGSIHFQHDADIVIEVPEKGKATQNSRFNQGGEMQVLIIDFPIPK